MSTTIEHLIIIICIPLVLVSFALPLLSCIDFFGMKVSRMLYRYLCYAFARLFVTLLILLAIYTLFEII